MDIYIYMKELERIMRVYIFNDSKLKFILQEKGIYKIIFRVISCML